MKLSEIEIVVGAYITQEVIPNIPSTLERFLIGAGSALVLNKGEVFIGEYIPILKKLGIMDNNGEIDIARLYSASKQGLKSSGGKIEYKSFTFNENDVDKLYSMLKEVEDGKQALHSKNPSL